MGHRHRICNASATGCGERLPLTITAMAAHSRAIITLRRILEPKRVELIKDGQRKPAIYVEPRSDGT